MSSPLSAALEKFRPRTEQVLVGDETVLTLRPLSVMGQGEFLTAMAALDWTPVIERIQPTIEGLMALNLDDRSAVGPFVMDALKTLARDGVPLLRAILGVALAPACGVLLDNEANQRALVQSGILSPDDRLTEGPVYLRSEQLRAWVTASVTAQQANHILTVAIELNGWKDLAGKAWAAVTTRTTTAPKVNGTKPALVETVTG